MTIEARLDRIIELLEAMSGSAAAAAAAEDPPAEPAKGGKKGTTGGKKGAKKTTLTLDAVKDYCVEISGSKAVKQGKEKVIALLGRFGCTALKDLEEDKYDEFFEQLGQIEAGEDPRDSNTENENDPF